MEEKNKSMKDDAIVRRLMESAKKAAPENLKYRIMHQVETEQALTRKNIPVQTEAPNVLKDFLSIFGGMYAVLAILAGGTYFTSGKEAILAPQFLWMAILVAFIFSIFWLITSIDASIRIKKRKNISGDL